MEETKKITKGFFQIAGFILLIPSIFIWIHWIKTFQSYTKASPSEKTKLFLDYFPSIIQNIYIINFITIITLILAIIFSSIRIKDVKTPFKVLGIFSIIIGSLILLLQLFALL